MTMPSRTPRESRPAFLGDLLDTLDRARPRPAAAQGAARAGRRRRTSRRSATCCCRGAARPPASRSPARCSPPSMPPPPTSGWRSSGRSPTASGPTARRSTAAIEALRREGAGIEAIEALHAAAEPRRQELVRRLNLAPGGTAALVRMREELLKHLRAHPELRRVDADFGHLFGSWFNRGFLVLRHIDWTTPANILEKIIRYEAVHAIRQLGRPAQPARADRPALLRLLPPAARRRAADLRRGGADRGHPGPRRAAARPRPHADRRRARRAPRSSTRSPTPSRASPASPSATS